MPKYTPAKENNAPLSVLTAYDAPGARYAAAADIDIILVGDSLGPNTLGYDTVRDVTIDDMMHHTAAVRRGAPDTYILADIPFGSTLDPEFCLTDAQRLLRSGADAVKLEIEENRLDHLHLLSAKKIPLCAHIGYTPQTPWLDTAVQGKDFHRAEELLQLARRIRKSRAQMLVMELMPRSLAAYITQHLPIPTIGIGSGPDCDGEVQVCYDILGMSEKVFRHSRIFAPAGDAVRSAYGGYAAAVRAGEFPTASNCSDISPDLFNRVTGECPL
ncbi:MAG: 3-methyl-2-oxobutanoate hydroxymethyltransferase [Fibrobacterota bacterium]